MATQNTQNKTKIKIALAQINPCVGDFAGNYKKIITELDFAVKEDADLLIMPETAISGYPAEDLLLQKHFIAEAEKYIWQIINYSKNHKLGILLTSPTLEKHRGQELIYNSALLIENGEIKKIIHKKSLPNFGVFDEYRYFSPSPVLGEIEISGFTFAVLICEDMWHLKNLLLLQEKIIDGVLVLNASPYEQGKQETRIANAKNFVNSLKKPLIYLNQFGGQDCLVFDGNSFALQSDGELLLEMKQFSKDFAIIELEKTVHEAQFNNGKIDFPEPNTCEICNIYSGNEPLKGNEPNNNNLALQSTYDAVVFGLREYFEKNNYQKAIIGMSGGIDSAIVATIATDALGCENIKLYALPTKFNSNSSLEDANNCAKNLGNNLVVLPIEELYQDFLLTLEGKIGSEETAISNNLELKDLTCENLQARIRGNILMAISNQNNSLLLATSNKSEIATGYGTIYGDMCGAINPIKDIYKTQIYQLANYRNNNISKIGKWKNINLIPQNIITKEPSAELKPNQKDSDSLPPYPVLDQILEMLIEKRYSVAEIIKQGRFAEALILQIAKLIKRSEYKRRQAPIGIKVSSCSFDKDWRMPITNKF